MWNEKFKKLEKRNNKKTEMKNKLEMLKIISAQKPACKCL